MQNKQSQYKEERKKKEVNSRMESHLGFKCFYCGDTKHLVKAWPWKNFACVNGCTEKISIYWSSQQKSYGCRFIRCRCQPCLRAFKWIDEPEKKNEVSEASSSNVEGSGHVKVIVEEKGKKVTYEGNVDDVIELMNMKLL